MLNFLTKVSRLQKQREPLLPKALGKSEIDEREQQVSGDGQGQPEAFGDGEDQPEAPGDGEDHQQACGDIEDLQRSSADDEDEQHSCRDGQDQQQASVAPAASIDGQDPATLSSHGSCVQTRQFLSPGSFLSRGSSLRSGDFAALLLPGQLPSRTSQGGATSCYQPYSLPVCLRPMETQVTGCLAVCISDAGQYNMSTTNFKCRLRTIHDRLQIAGRQHVVVVGTQQKCCQGVRLCVSV